MLPKTYHIYKMKKWSRSRSHGLERAVDPKDWTA